jgi:predicted MPP superfamily phosphohydrolase
MQKLPVAFLAFFSVALGFVGAVHAYIGARVVAPQGLDGLPAALAYGALVLSALLIPGGLVARFFAPPAIADRLAWVGLTLMGFMSFLFVGTLARDLIWVALGVFGALPANDGVQAALLALSGAVLVPAGVMASGVGYYFARRVPPVLEVPVELPGLDARLDGFTLVQISDVHVGPTIKRPQIERLVEEINTLNADAVVITGDLVDGSVHALRDDVAPLAGLRARHGVFFATGNHEYYAGVDAWVAELRRLGMAVLLDEHRVLDHDGAALVIAGITDHGADRMHPHHRSDPARAIAGAPPGVPRILLAHQPRSAAAAAEAGFDLQLSGHTHGGQFVPWNFLVPLQQPFTHGLRRWGRLQVYTSRGTGYWGPPLRLGAPSEITRVVLRRAG